MAQVEPLSEQIKKLFRLKKITEKSLGWNNYAYTLRLSMVKSIESLYVDPDKRVEWDNVKNTIRRDSQFLAFPSFKYISIPRLLNPFRAAAITLTAVATSVYWAADRIFPIRTADGTRTRLSSKPARIIKGTFAIPFGIAFSALYITLAGISKMAPYFVPPRVTRTPTKHTIKANETTTLLDKGLGITPHQVKDANSASLSSMNAPESSSAKSSVTVAREDIDEDSEGEGETRNPLSAKKKK